MAHTSITGLQNTAVTLNNTDSTLYISPTGQLDTNTSSAITISSSATGSIYIQVNGSVYNTSRGIYLSTVNEGARIKLSVAETGSIQSISTAVLLGGDNQVAVNAGYITSASNWGVGLYGDGSYIQNSGSITAFNYGVIALDSATVLNSGLIDSFTSTGVIVGSDSEIFNSGTVRGSLHGVSFGADGVLTNTGDIYSFADSAVLVNGSGSEILNSGLISSTGASTFAVRTVHNDVSILNSGLIESAWGAVLITGSNVNFENSGTVRSVGEDAVTIQGIDSEFLNSGLITSAEDGVRFDRGTGGYFKNSGEISATSYGLAGFDVFGSVKIVNTGIISGTPYALRITNDSASSAFGHIVVNSGQLLGDVSLSQGNDVYNGRSGFVSGTIDGGEGDDIITGGEAADVIDGGNGANEIRSLGGDDTITTGDDADFIASGAGDDEIVSGHGDDTIRGGDGEDDINGQGGVDFIQGGGGNDYIRMGNGDGQRGEGNAGDDYIAGGNQKDVLLGGADEDELIGQGGDDVLRGGTGDDVLEGGTGDDRIIGNAGEDTAVFSGALADYTFTLNGNGTVDVEDTVGTDGIDNLFGVELVEFTDGTYLLSDFV